MKTFKRKRQPADLKATADVWHKAEGASKAQVCLFTNSKTVLGAYSVAAVLHVCMVILIMLPQSSQN